MVVNMPTEGQGHQMGAMGAGIGGVGKASSVLEDADRAAAEKDRFLKQAQYALEGGGFEEAAMHFTSALALMPKVATPSVAFVFAGRNEWEPGDERRMEAAGAYSNRSAAHAGMGRWLDALNDGLAASGLAPAHAWAMEAFAAAAAKLAPNCSLIGEARWSALMPAQLRSHIPAELLKMGPAQVCHALAADASAMLVEAYQFVHDTNSFDSKASGPGCLLNVVNPGSPQPQAIRRSGSSL